MRYFLVIILFSLELFGQNTNILIIEKQKGKSTTTSNSSKDIYTSVEYYSLKYYLDTPNLLYLVGLSYQPIQIVGNTTLYSFPIEIKQKMEKLELGTAYKYYVTDSLYIGPAIIYKNTQTKNFQYMNRNGTIISSRKSDVDIDYSLYAILGYKPSKTSSMILSLELKNDILSNNYTKDFSTYQFNASILQGISKNIRLYFKYTKSFRDKPATSFTTGTKDVSGLSLGIGFQF